MKILVSTPENSSSKELKTFLEAIKYLKKLGHNVIENITSEGKTTSDGMKRNFSQTEKYIKDTDILLVEASDPDPKIGYDIARALDEKKVVIAMEDEKAKNSTQIIHGNESRQLISVKYSAKNVEDVTEKAIKEALGRLDSKFILIISPEMDRYLNWASKAKRTHKAQVVRTALEGLMRKDKEYREYVGRNE